MRTLTINYGLGVENRPNYHGFEVVDECGRTTGALCLGEVFEQVLEMIHPSMGKVRYPMLTPEQWEQRWKCVHEKAPAEPLQHTEDPDHGEHLA
jgi:hypothetical protein